MSSSQFAEWLAFSAIDPIGRESRNELRHGQMMHLLDSAHFKRSAPAAIADFMNYVESPPERELTPEEIERYMKSIFGA